MFSYKYFRTVPAEVRISITPYSALYHAVCQTLSIGVAIDGNALT